VIPYAASFKNLVLEMFKGDAEALADFQLASAPARSPFPFPFPVPRSSFLSASQSLSTEPSA
jgi:hypothetical protein